MEAAKTEEDAPLITVIVPHLEQEEALRRCLSSLAAQEGVSQPFEIIVVDNGSKSPPMTVCKEFANVTLLRQLVPGPGPARNLGVENAKGEILAFIDADCLADPRWLASIESRFAQDGSLNILGGDVKIAMDDKKNPTLLEAYESVFAYRMKEYIAKQGFTGTGNLAVRAAIFAKIGPFGGINIAEDRDWGQRALSMGYRTHYCPEMIVFHPARKTMAELMQKWERHTAHDFELIQGKSMWRLRWILRGLAVGVSPAAEVFRIGLSDRLNGLKSRVLAFLGVVYIRIYRSWLMLSLAMGVDASRLSARWNRT